MVDQLICKEVLRLIDIVFACPRADELQAPLAGPSTVFAGPTWDLVGRDGRHLYLEDHVL